MVENSFTGGYAAPLSEPLEVSSVGTTCTALAVDRLEGAGD